MKLYSVKCNKEFCFLTFIIWI